MVGNTRVEMMLTSMPRNRSTSDHMDPAIHRSLALRARRQTLWHPPYVGLCPRSSRESSACLTFPHTTSTTWHQEMPCIGPYPVTTPVNFLTGPFIGYPVTDQLTGPVTSPVTGHRSLTGPVMTGHRSPVIDRSPVTGWPVRSPVMVTGHRSPVTLTGQPVTGHWPVRWRHRSPGHWPVTGHRSIDRSPVTGHWPVRSPVTGQPVTGHRSPVTGHWPVRSPVTDRSGHRACYDRSGHRVPVCTTDRSGHRRCWHYFVSAPSMPRNRSTSDHMGPAIHRSLAIRARRWPKRALCCQSVDVRPYGIRHTSVFAQGQSRESSACRDFSPHDFNHIASEDAMHRSLPGDDTGHILTGPFIGYLVTDQLTGPVTSPVTGQHWPVRSPGMPWPVTSPVIGHVGLCPRSKSGKFGLPWLFPTRPQPHVIRRCHASFLTRWRHRSYFDRSVHRVHGDRPVHRSTGHLWPVNGQRSLTGPVTDRSGHRSCYDRSGHRVPVCTTDLSGHRRCWHYFVSAPQR